MTDAGALQAHFDEMRSAIRAYYLAEPGNPYRQSGRGRGAERWEETRRCIADAVHRSGTFLDVGCANGLLLETLSGWLSPRSIAIEPFGIDFVPELVELARARLPHVPPANFRVANAWDWQPAGRFDFVRTNLEYVPEAWWDEWVRRHLERMVAPGGRLILCWYHSTGGPDTPPETPSEVLRRTGLDAAGTASAPGVRIAWADRDGQ